MSKLFRVFDAITDSAASEYFAENTESLETIKDYAFGGMELVLSDIEAMILYISFNHLKKYDEEGISLGTDGYYRLFEEPLDDFSDLLVKFENLPVSEEKQRIICKEFLKPVS